MGFQKRIKYYLVHSLKQSNKAAQELISTGAIELNGEKIYDNCLLEETAEIRISNRIIRDKKEFVYLKFYKPVGFESSLNPKVQDNLSAFFKDYDDLAIAGRLDKASEGLLLLSNNGKWIEEMCHPKFEKEKEYLVDLDKVPDEYFLRSFEAGVDIGKHVTAPCHCIHLKDNMVKILLKEGKNRQIRRMCKALGYKVIRLRRFRIASITLEHLIPGESLSFSI